MKNYKEIMEGVQFTLLKNYPFFGSIVHLSEVEVKSTKDMVGYDTFVTNGHSITVSPSFMDTLTLPQLLAVYAHEVLHVAMAHPQRMFKLVKNKEDHDIANIAADLLVNAILKDLNFDMTKVELVNDKFTPDKYSLEQLFWYLKRNMKEMPKKPQNMPQCMPCGDSPDDGGTKDGKDGKGMSISDLEELEAQMKAILERAAEFQRMAGKGSPLLDRMVESWKKPIVNWRELLQDWMMKKTKSDLTWAVPHRRTFSNDEDIYFPSKTGTKIGHVGVAIDLSGSIGQKETALFLGQMSYIFEMTKPSKVTVITFDDGIRDEMEFEEMPSSIKFRGGGGTDFRPVFKRFGEIQKECESTADKFECLVFMTDLCGPFPDKEPDYPTLFFSTYKGAKAPWGEVINAEDMMSSENKE